MNSAEELKHYSLLSASNRNNLLTCIQQVIYTMWSDWCEHSENTEHSLLKLKSAGVCILNYFQTDICGNCALLIILLDLLLISTTTKSTKSD